MEEIVRLLIEKNVSISSVESFTVGNFALALGSVPGVSAVYKGSLVSYQNIIKHKVLGIPQEVIDTYGVVSNEVAGLMCINGQKMFDTDLCISFTGNAGPDAMEGKKVGLIYIGIAYKSDVHTYEYELSGSRKQIVEQAIAIGKMKISEILK